MEKEVDDLSGKKVSGKKPTKIDDSFHEQFEDDGISTAHKNVLTSC